VLAAARQAQMKTAQMIVATLATKLNASFSEKTQADVSNARDGSIIFHVTPKVFDSEPQHQVCVALEFNNFPVGELRTNTNTELIERAIISAEGNGIGPGLRTYDANSETGILLVITITDDSGTEFSLRATNIHP